MDVIKFTLKGRTAFFKKPDVNTYLYFTYSNIHKVALLGICGAILGYKGYNQMSFNKKYKKYFKEVINDDKTEYPEFYDKLKDLKIGIVPSEVSIKKKIQVFNNSVGYASKEQGGNLIVKEQWLENPSWDIYISLDHENGRELKDALINRRFVYIPYLGKNDHPADIKDVEIFSDVKEKEKVDSIDSLFIREDFKIVKEDVGVGLFDLAEESDRDKVPTFKYEEKLPMSLDKDTNKYEYKSFIFTNEKVKKLNNISVYNINNKNIVLF